MLNRIINDLAEPAKHAHVGEYVRELGARHVDFQTRGFRLKYWDVFEEAMTDCALEWEGGLKSVSGRTAPPCCRIAETMRAYRLFVFYVVGEMREGFIAELNRRRVRCEAVDNQPVALPDDFPPIMVQGGMEWRLADSSPPAQ